MGQHSMSFSGQPTLRNAFLLFCLFTHVNTDNHAVYRLTFKVSDVRFAGTKMNVSIALFSHKGSRIKTWRSQFQRNKTDIFDLMSNSTRDKGPICKVDLKVGSKGGDDLVLNQLNVANIATSDVGIFIPTSTTEKTTEVTVTHKQRTFQRYDTQWGLWGECTCETAKRWRQRHVPNCGAKAVNETESQYCQSISVICDSQKKYIIIGSGLGFIVLILAVVVSLWCIKKRPQSAPTIHIKMTPKVDAPVASLRPELGSTLRLEMIEHGSSALTLPRSTPKLMLLEEEERLEEEYLEEEYLEEEMYAPRSVLSSVQSLPYEDLYSRPRAFGQLPMPATTSR